MSFMFRVMLGSGSVPVAIPAKNRKVSPVDGFLIRIRFFNIFIGCGEAQPS